MAYVEELYPFIQHLDHPAAVNELHRGTHVWQVEPRAVFSLSPFLRLEERVWGTLGTIATTATTPHSSQHTLYHDRG